MCFINIIKMRENFDQVRNLEDHHKNREGRAFQGDCFSCADAWCRYNVTVREIIEAVEQGDLGAVKQFNCIDADDDESIPKDLR